MFFHPNNFLHLLLGDEWSLPGQLGVVIPPTGPGSALDPLPAGQNRNRQPGETRRSFVNCSLSCMKIGDQFAVVMLDVPDVGAHGGL